ncbi:nucleotidyltransferase domain-containing protein [bacterium]|nr:nucleotidyltransferase domain-containing protein [bacterium]
MDTMNVDSILSKMVDKIKTNFNPERIILFGSYSTGEANINSDIDLMVILDTNMPPHKRAVPIRRILKGSGIPKDIIVKTPEEFNRFKDFAGSIVYTAAHQGKVLYER